MSSTGDLREGLLSSFTAAEDSLDNNLVVRDEEQENNPEMPPESSQKGFSSPGVPDVALVVSSNDVSPSPPQDYNDDADDFYQQESSSASASIAQISARLSNFSTSYNVVNISLVLPILNELIPRNSSTPEDQAACASSLLAGMILGQLAGGALGDSWLGRLGALRFVMILQIVASLGSAIGTTTSTSTTESSSGMNIYIQLSIWRFILGISAGAVYPLAATLSAEEGTSTTALGRAAPSDDAVAQDKTQQLKNVVLTFAMQGVGFLAVPLVAVPLLYTTSNLDLTWRFILGLGSIPGIILMLLQGKLYYQQREQSVQPVVQAEPDEAYIYPDITNNSGEGNTIPTSNFDETVEEAFLDEEDGVVNITLENPGIWHAIKNEPDLMQKLLGTAGSWFLFDVLFYGNTLFQPVVMEAAFGGAGSSGDDDKSRVRKASMDSLILACIALPGYIVSAIVIGRKLCYITQTPRYVQMQGFAVMGLLYATIGVFWGYLKRIPVLLVFLYGLTFFFANYGPNTTTFVFPSLVYSPSCRSTLNGISAAAGKLGALLGATLFEPASAVFGDSIVMLICAGISVTAFALTRCFVRIPNQEV